MIRMVQHLEEMYDKAEQESNGFKFDFEKSVYEFDKALQELPDRFWIE